MKVFLALLLFGFTSHGLSQNLPMTPAVGADPSWIIDPGMSDEFNSEYTPGIVYDPAKWQCAEVNNQPHVLSSCQVYDQNHVKIVNPGPNGFLQLTATNTPSTCQNYGVTMNEDFSTGRLSGFVDRQYGYFEVRARIDDVPAVGNHEGIGAEIWLFRKDPWNNQWSEIDLAEIDCGDNRHTCNVIWDPHEYPPGLDPWHPHYTVDWPTTFNDTYCNDPGWHQNAHGWANQDGETWVSNSHDNMRCAPLSNPCSCPSPPDFNLSPGWHLFQCQWTPGEIIMWVDGVYVNSTTLGCPGLEEMVWIIGPTVADGQNGVVNQFSSSTNSGTVFPFNMDVDYIRTYYLDYDCNSAINDCYFDVMSYDHKVKESITFGNCVSTTVDVGSGVFMKAENYIQINGDFTVPLGAEFEADIYVCP